MRIRLSKSFLTDLGKFYQNLAGVAADLREIMCTPYEKFRKMVQTLLFANFWWYPKFVAQFTVMREGKGEGLERARIIRRIPKWQASFSVSRNLKNWRKVA